VTVQTSNTAFHLPWPDDAETQRRLRLIEALVLERAAERAWRVCDSRIATGPDRFLAFVEEKTCGFEVMQVADRFVWSVFATMPAALDYIVISSPGVSAARSIGELAWP
jgi:hypothetical protein